ncbi:MAG: peptidoglycan-associated lipoprotein, partial [Pseudomonadota bacterium]|nr:peptidoglycan-associated lipoprotein [Pseudomonadota bacterium]
MKIDSRHLFTALALASLAACSSVKLDDTPVETRNPGNPTGTSAGAGGGGSTSQTRVASVDAGNIGAATIGNLPRVVYFDYDSYLVKDEFRPVVEVNARALSANAKLHMAVEGHTDDRGSSEYNL